MNIKVIKNKEDYQKCLLEAEHLVGINPKIGTTEADRLELLAVLIEKYEEEHYYIGLPSAIEAIKFRMEQQGLKQRDLIPFIGSKSKVSEILSGKRSLTTDMIRALNSSLGIPVDVLLQNENDNNCNTDESIEWEKFPIKEMINRGWIDSYYKKHMDKARDAVSAFLKPIANDMPMEVFCRRTIHERVGKELDKYSLYAWIAAVLIKAREMSSLPRFDQNDITNNFLKEVAKLSRFNDGPLRAKEYLANNGIALVIEPHLPKTKLDGCAILSESQMAIIGLTIRYDRLDNFWHTLLHELVHIVLHTTSNKDIFVDNLDVGGGAFEKDADKRANEILIPRAEWMCSPAKREKTPAAIQELADRLEIHPAIIAGRIRRELNNYSILNQLVGHGKVRMLFKDVEWK